MAMQMNTVATPQYTVSSFPYNNNNATMCQLNTYDGYMPYFFADIYTLQLPAGLFTITATMAPGASGAQDIAMILYDSNGNQVATGLPNANGNYPLDSPGTFQFTGPGGTYTLVLESYGAAYTGRVPLSALHLQSISGAGAHGEHRDVRSEHSDDLLLLHHRLGERDRERCFMAATGAPAGSVTATLDGANSQTVNLTNGTASLSWTITPSGSNHTVNATYNPMGNTAGSPAGPWLACPPASLTLPVIPLTTIYVGGNYFGQFSSTTYSGPGANTSPDRNQRLL